MDSRNRMLWVGNLSERTKEEILYELFLQAGPLEKVTIPVKDGRPQKFGFVTFKHECSVPYAIQLLDGIRVWGNPLRLQPRTGATPTLSLNNSPAENIPSGSQGQFNQSPTAHNQSPSMQRGNTWPSSRNQHDGREFLSPGNRDLHGHGGRDIQGQGGSHSRGNSKWDNRFEESRNMEHIPLQGNSHFNNSPQEMKPRDLRDQDYYNEKRERLMNKQKASLDVHRHRHERRGHDHMQNPYDRGGRQQPWQSRPYRH
uniref:RRM domain-containing protein n=1 Tax=Magallana gigas TaxID=29159 RepID=A0A8W8LKF7_MAGGI